MSANSFVNRWSDRGLCGCLLIFLSVGGGGGLG